MDRQSVLEEQKEKKCEIKTSELQWSCEVH